MKIAIIGANGQLGHDVVGAFQKQGASVTALTHEQIEITSIDSISKILRECGPDLIVNTAAAHQVEQCEEHPDHAYQVNAIGAKNLALVSNDLDAILMHISTDYVFNGNKKNPYLESDVPIPLNVYGSTKLAGEHFIQNIADKYFIFRVSGLYGKAPCRAKGGLNFVQLMLKLAKERDEVRVIDNEILTPTHTGTVARQLVKMASTDFYGLYHATAQGSCSWFEFARKIFELAQTTIKLSIADPSEFPMKVPRPEYSVLENAALKKIGEDLMLPWEQDLSQYLEGL